MKYLERNKVLVGLDIKYNDYRIKSAQINYKPVDIVEFRIQIKELLDLGVIQPSNSPHRSAAFMVRNHAEIKRGKIRMVINYKRLNDNTEDDKCNIPDKDRLINRKHTSRIFSKFDCKLGF